MTQQTYIVTFHGISSADANRYAEELRNALLDATSEITVQRRRVDPQTQDFGSTLILILGTPAVVATAAAVGNWLKLRTSASLTIEIPGKRVIAQNINSKDAARLVELLLAQQQENPE